MSTTPPVPRTPQSRGAGGPLTRQLLDDAAIFPPGNASLPDAVTEHGQHLSSWYAPAVGPLLVRLGDAAALHDLLPDGRRLAVGLVCPPSASADDITAAAAEVQRNDRADVVALEQPVSDRAAADRLVAAARVLGARCWAELPPDCTLDGTVGRRLDDVAAAGSYAKYRTGGVRPAAFPDEQRLARFLAFAVRRELPFKLTAGLHHATRHTARGAGVDGEDLEQHGVLNVVTAVAAALGGSEQHDLAGLLSDRDSTAVSGRVRALDDETLAQVRAVFRSFGCCGVTDPLTDLVTLGLLEQPTSDDSDTKETS
jgi:hypothetical protein